MNAPLISARRRLQACSDRLDAELASLPRLRAWALAQYSQALATAYPGVSLDVNVACVKTFDARGQLLSQRTLEALLFEALTEPSQAYDDALSGVYAAPVTGDQPTTRIRSTLPLEKVLEAMRSRLARGFAQQFEQYWAAVQATAPHSRGQRITALLQDALSTQLDVDIEAGRLQPGDRALLATALNTPISDEPRAYTLALTFENAALAQHVAGACLVTRDSLGRVPDLAQAREGRALLYVPGHGWRELALPLWSSLQQCSEDPAWVQACASLLPVDCREALQDGSFDWSLIAAQGNPVAQGLDTLRGYQQQAMAQWLGGQQSPFHSLEDLDEGLQALLEAPHLAQQLARHDAEQALQAAEPAWLASASVLEMAEVGKYLRDHEALQRLLEDEGGELASAAGYIRARVAQAVKNASGHLVDPDLLMVHVPRLLANGSVTGHWSRSLAWLGEHGLPWGDEMAGSALLTQGTLTYADAPLPAAWSTITVALLARVLAPLQVRVDFVVKQRDAWTAGRRELLARALAAQARLTIRLSRLQHDVGDAHVTMLDTLFDPLALGAQDGLTLRPVVQGTRVLADYLVLHQASVPKHSAWWLLFNLGQGQGASWHRVKNEAALADFIPGATEAQPISLGAGQGAVDAFMGLADRHLAQRLARSEAHTSPAYCTASVQDRRRLLLHEEHLLLLQAHYRATYPLVAFHEFALAQAQPLLDQWLGGPAGRFHPDQIRITVAEQTQTFTEVMIQGVGRAFKLPLDLTTAGPGELGYISRPADDPPLSVEGAEGVPAAGLTYRSLEQRVGQPWLADRYCTHIESQLLDTTAADYPQRRYLSAEMTRVQMLAGALHAQLQGSISMQHYVPLKARIEALHGQGGLHTLHPLVFDLDGVWNSSEHRWLRYLPSPALLLMQAAGSEERVEGVYIFKHGEERWLYTPGAPDGLAFRPLSAYVATLASPAMIDYFLARVSVNNREWMSYVLAAVAEGATPPPRAGTALEDLPAVFYDVRVRDNLNRVRQSSATQARALREIIEGALVVLEVMVAIATLAFPPAAAVAGLVFMVKELALMAIAFQQHEKSAVGGYLFSAALNGLGIAGDLAVGGKTALMARLVRSQAAQLPAKANIPLHGITGTEVLRGLDRRLALKRGPGNLADITQGRYAGALAGPIGIDGLAPHYICDELGRYFRVRYDDAFDALRVVEPRRMGYGPLVQRDEAGLWRLANDIGLRGGNPAPGMEAFEQVLAAMPAPQLNAYFASDIAASLRHDEAGRQHLWQRFRFDLRAELEELMVVHLRQHQRLPEWGRALLGHGEEPLVMVQRRYPGLTAQDWADYLEHFDFSGGNPTTWTRHLALHIEVFGGTSMLASRQLRGGASIERLAQANAVLRPRPGVMPQDALQASPPPVIAAAVEQPVRAPAAAPLAPLGEAGVVSPLVPQAAPLSPGAVAAPYLEVLPFSPQVPTQRVDLLGTVQRGADELSVYVRPAALGEDEATTLAAMQPVVYRHVPPNMVYEGALFDPPLQQQIRERFELDHEGSLHFARLMLSEANGGQPGFAAAQLERVREAAAQWQLAAPDGALAMDPLALLRPSSVETLSRHAHRSTFDPDEWDRALYFRNVPATGITAVKVSSALCRTGYYTHLAQGGFAGVRTHGLELVIASQYSPAVYVVVCRRQSRTMESPAMFFRPQQLRERAQRVLRSLRDHAIIDAAERWQQAIDTQNAHFLLANVHGRVRQGIVQWCVKIMKIQPS